MPSSGPQIYRSALLFEIIANLVSLPQLFFYPDSVLVYAVPHPSNITPEMRSGAWWLGGLVVTVTIPLYLSYREPTPGRPSAELITHRKATYGALGASEVAIGAAALLLPVFGVQTGFTETALLGIFTIMSAFVGMRAFFLLGKPHWMEGKDDAVKRE